MYSWLPVSLSASLPVVSRPLDVSSYGPEMVVCFPERVSALEEPPVAEGLGFLVQKLRVIMGRRMGMLTVMMPTMVSRTPQRLMLRAEGEPARVRMTRMSAAAMTKIPEERRTPMTIFLR